jgi:hypothetical protein
VILKGCNAHETPVILEKSGHAVLDRLLGVWNNFKDAPAHFFKSRTLRLIDLREELVDL